MGQNTQPGSHLQNILKQEEHKKFLIDKLKSLLEAATELEKKVYVFSQNFNDKFTGGPHYVETLESYRKEIEKIKNDVQSLNLKDELAPSVEQTSSAINSLLDGYEHNKKIYLGPLVHATWQIKEIINAEYDRISKSLPSKKPITTSSKPASADLSIIPDEILKEIFAFIDKPSIGLFRQVSKKMGNLADQVLTKTDKVVDIISKLPSFQAILFIKYYCSTPAGKELLNKQKKEPDKMNSYETLCHALITDDIYSINQDALKKALTDTMIKLNPDIYYNLKIILNLIILEHTEDKAEKKTLIQNLQLSLDKKNRTNTKYINLQKANLAQLHFGWDNGNFGGANLLNAVLPNRDNTHSFPKLISEEAFINKKNFNQELDNLLLQIKNHPEESALRFCIRNQMEWKFHVAIPDMQLTRLKKYPIEEQHKEVQKCLALIEVALTHPIFIEHRKGKDFKKSVQKYSLGFIEFKTDSYKDLLRWHEKLTDYLKKIPPEKKKGPTPSRGI